MKQIETKDILEFSESIMNEDPSHTYHKSYRYFVNYFRDKAVLDEQDLIIGANFSYGWMPTILNLKSEKFKESVDILNKAKGSTRISTNELLVLKSLVNNSIVGVSKLLHFVNPNIYAIWDSRVCKFIFGKSTSHRVQKVELYWEYLDLCQRVADEESFKKVHADFESLLDYEVSSFRVVEQIMFINSESTISEL